MTNEPEPTREQLLAMLDAGEPVQLASGPPIPTLSIVKISANNSGQVSETTAGGTWVRVAADELAAATG